MTKKWNKIGTHNLPDQKVDIRIQVYQRRDKEEDITLEHRTYRPAQTFNLQPVSAAAFDFKALQILKNEGTAPALPPR